MRYTAVFNYLEGNDINLMAGMYLNLESDDNNLRTGMFDFLAGVNHVLETYLFLRLTSSILTAHPVESIMTLQD